METKTSFFNRTKWSDNKYAWTYAILILLLTVIFALILKILDIYEGMALRILHVIFILAGFILLMWDHNRHKKEPLSYTKAFLLLVRTGVYFCLILLPILLIFLETNASALDTIREKETYTSDYPVIQIVFSTYLETFATVLIAAMTVAYLANSRKKQ